MIHHQIDQNCEAWMRLRMGIPTASSFDRIVTKSGKPSTQAEAYMNWLLAEWVLDAPLESPETQWMARGHELEPMALRSYAFERDLEPEPGGFWTTDDGMIGASPDSIVGADGLLELKCPAPQTHIGYMLSRDLDAKYWTQLQGQLYVTERAWVDIQSYCPGLPTVIIRVTRNEQFIAALDAGLREFVDSMLAKRQSLEASYGPFVRHVERELKADDPMFMSAEDAEVLIRDSFPR